MVKIITDSPEKTIDVAKKIGELLKPNDLIAFKGG